MSKPILIVACMLLMLQAPFIEAKTHRSNIPRSARHSHNSGAKNFKYKPGPKQKLKHHKS